MDKNLTEKEIFNLSSAVRNFFQLVYTFVKNKNIANFVNVWMLEDPIQVETTITSGPSELHFYENLFFTDKNSKLQSYKKLTNVALERILNKLFTLDQENVEQILNKFIKQRQINMIWLTLTDLCLSPILVYIKLVTLDRFSFCGEKITNKDKDWQNVFSIKGNCFM